MKKVAGFVSMAVLAFTVVGCSDSMSPAAPTPLSATDASTSSSSDAARGGRASLPTIAGTAVAAAPEFTTLVAALDKAGLVETFNGNRQFTVFAPTNDAFDAAAKALLKNDNATGMDLIEALDVATLTAVLQYHVTLGDRNAQSVVSAGQLRMLDGNAAAVSVMNGSAYIAGAKILQADVLASNGIIHVIDSVILPPSGD
jgi:uncharacterized surface protein with fasciclin (FAS1) repeats